MRTQSFPGKPDRLLGVDLLAKFEFCIRAGLLNAEIPSEDTGEEEDTPQRLDYLPDYEEVIIRNRLTSLMRRFWLILGSLLIELAGVGYFARNRMELSILCGVVMCVSLVWWFNVFRAIAIMRSRLDAAEEAAPREPDERHLIEETFNWWELRKAGYQVDRMPQPMIDPGKGIIGRPWRVLRKGDIRIPVFRKHRGDNSVHSQQRVRIAAYCHLIETCEGSKAPFGLVLFGGSYDAVLVPNSRPNKILLDTTIATAEKVLRAGAEWQHLKAPASSCCKSCPFGAPVPVTENSVTTPESNVGVYPVVGLGGQFYRSPCGDRYRWIPPHERAERLRLHEA
ncbi:MAG: hypothetical protein R3C59_00220 [Planctomycetaceae bacterium]